MIKFSITSSSQVRTWKMNLYTLCQVGGLAVLWAVKSSILALAFPFFVVAMIFYRLLLGCFFSKRELDAVREEEADNLCQNCYYNNVPQ